MGHVSNMDNELIFVIIKLISIQSNIENRKARHYISKLWSQQAAQKERKTQSHLIKYKISSTTFAMLTSLWD